MQKKVDMGMFFPYINGRYVNPYVTQKDPTIRKGQNMRGTLYEIKYTDNGEYRKEYIRAFSKDYALQAVKKKTPKLKVLSIEDMGKGDINDK